MITQPGLLIGPLMFGLVVDATGSFRPAWFLMTIFLAVAILVTSAVREKSAPTTS